MLPSSIRFAETGCGLCHLTGALPYLSRDPLTVKPICLLINKNSLILVPDSLHVTQEGDAYSGEKTSKYAVSMQSAALWFSCCIEDGKGQQVDLTGILEP